jgi:hypothetical protein
MSIPISPDALLTREQLSDVLKELGFPIESSTLATKATRGGGPPYQRFGLRCLYRWGDALEWAKSLLSAPRRNTSEGDVIEARARKPSPKNHAPSRPRKLAHRPRRKRVEQNQEASALQSAE